MIKLLLAWVAVSAFVFFWPSEKALQKKWRKRILLALVVGAVILALLFQINHIEGV